jgi:hypothetical protein
MKPAYVLSILLILCVYVCVYVYMHTKEKEKAKGYASKCEVTGAYMHARAHVYLHAQAHMIVRNLATLQCFLFSI